MPFEPGNQLWRKAVPAKKEKYKRLEEFLVMLACGGVDEYGDLMSRLVNDKELSKSQQEFMDRFEGWREFILPKLARTQNETEVKGEVNFKWDKQS
jgi:hypothetical protein